jgi:hypothetical protein
MERNTNLVALATEVQRQFDTRKDYVAPAPAIHLDAAVPIDGGTNPPKPGRELTVRLNGDTPYGITPFAHKQIAEHVEIPARYYERMRSEAPALLAENVNEWLRREPDTKRMLRTLDGNVRAFVSPKFHPLDNYDLLESVLPTFQNLGAVVKQAQLTETHIYIVATLESLRTNVPGSRRVGDIVEGGVIISNSEVGDGTLYARGYLNFLFCTNGMVRSDANFKRYHVGKAVEADADIREILSDEAQRADTKAIFLKLRDVTRALFDATAFRAYVKRVGDTTQDAIEAAKVERVVDLTIKELALPEARKAGILTELIKSADLSRYGLVNAITFQTHDEADAETAIELERAGGKLIDLPETAWKRIADGREATKKEIQAEAVMAAGR